MAGANQRHPFATPSTSARPLEKATTSPDLSPRFATARSDASSSLDDLSDRNSPSSVMEIDSANWQGPDLRAGARARIDVIVAAIAPLNGLVDGRREQKYPKAGWCELSPCRR